MQGGHGQHDVLALVLVHQMPFRVLFEPQDECIIVGYMRMREPEGDVSCNITCMCACA